MTQIAQRNNHVLQMLKRLKETLENDKKKYADKVNVLVMTWERIAASAREQRPLAAICIVEKMYKDTLSIMLQGEWPKMSPVSKTHLMQMLNRCRIDLCKEMPWLDYKFKKLLELVNEPWTLPSLERIMHKDPSPATPEQIIEFCESERGLLIVTRLTMLCSSRCEKVAIRLAEACFNALTSANSCLIGLFTSYEYHFIFDIYLCLLYKYKKLESIINALKPVIVNDGYAMVLRLKKRIDMHEQKIWKFSVQVATIAARYFVTVSMLSRSIPNSVLLKNLINDWLSMSNASQNNLENEIRKIIQPAETSEHIYIMAEVLAKMFQQIGNQMYSSLIMELYIRALTADINYLERVKLQNDREQITAYEKHLAAKFLEMADLVKDHAGVRREFVLTAFSIHPSAEIYRRVEEEAVASGKASPHSTPTSQESMEVGVLSEGLSSLSSEEPDVKETAIDYSVNNDSQDSGAFVEISNRCSLHLPYDGIGPEGELCFQCGDFTGVQNSRNLADSQQIKKERSLDALILIKGNTVTESLNYDVLSAPSQVLEAEKLGLSSQVCADLVTLLGSNRYHLLTWVLEWGELSSRCIRYMNEADTIKSGKKELKFLEIDYNQYKDWPENQEEGDCIEKGYEQWLEEDNTETDIDTDSKRSNTDDSEEMSMLKTAIRRSQKQMGRYAESSSDSDDYRARNKNKKRGKAKKRSKYMSDSGSISDCLGNDGQKQKRSNKKSRKESKDLKKLYSLRMLEMSGDNTALSCSKEKIPSEVMDNQTHGLPATLAARSDPTVLKSLRAFRLNAHKTKQNEFVQAIAKNCPNSKSYQGKMTSISKESVFDCNDNKFITKENRLIIKDNVLDMNFRTNGAKTKKYNDVIRSIKEDLISVSNIPRITNNATIQVIHLQDTSKPRDINQSQTSQVSASDTQTISTSSTSLGTGIEIISNEKLKPVNDSHGSQIRKATSSQPLGQPTETTSSSITVGKTYLPTAVTRNVPSRVMVSAFSNSVSNASDSSRVINQPQFRAIVSRNISNQNHATSNENVRNILNFQLSSVPSINANVKNTGQSLITQAEKTTVIATDTNTPTTSGSIKVIQGFERPFQNRNYLIQHLRANTTTLNVHDARQASSSGQNAPSSEVLNNSAESEKTKDSNGNALRINVTTLDSIKSFDSSKCENSLENLSCTGTNVIVNPTSKCSNAARALPVKYVNESDAQSINGSCSNNSNNFIKSPTETNVITIASQSQRPVINKPVQKFVSERIAYQTNLTSAHRNYSGQMNGATHNKQIPSSSVNVTQVSNDEEKNISSNSCSSRASEGSISTNAGQIKIVSTLAGLLSDTRNNSSGNSISASNFSRTSTTVPKVCGNKISCAEFMKVEDSKGTTTNPSSSSISTSSSSTLSLSSSSSSSLPSLPSSSTSSTSSSSSSSSSILSSTLSSNSLNNNNNSLSTLGISQNDDIGVLESPAEGFEVRLACKNLTNKNMLTTVLKQSSNNNKAPPPFAISHFSQFNARSEAADQTEPVSNVLISQSSTSNTIHYTVINPNTIQQNALSDGLNSNVGDMVERVVKQEDFANPRSVMPPSSSQIKNSTYDSCTSSKTAIVEENQRSDENVSGHQKVIVPSKRIKSNSSQSFGQNEASFIKKQVFNNQKITILVQNNGDNREEPENQQKNCKLSEFFVKDDQRPNITFRAIKRTPSNVNINEAPPSKKISQSISSNQNGEVEMRERRDGPIVDSKEDSNPPGTLCQYLVLEAINDPSGALPKFNQAFGKSYQIKLPQTVKAMDSSENIENDGSLLSESSKSDNKATAESHLTPLPLINQVPVTEAVKENPLEIIPKSVKSVYIDKEVKTEVHSSLKVNDGTIDSSASIPAIHMTEIQQPSANAFQNLSKVARSTVVQQLIRKIPTTGPSTLQAVTSISTVNSVNSRQGKAQDVVTTPTLIYATAARAQSQILIQRAVGRANAPTVNQVAPVIYTQQPSDQSATQTQTLLLAAVPTGTRGVVPGTQLVRLPSNSGIWRMTPSVNSSRIVQLRPQNLVLQGNQDQGVVMHSSQPVLLHHLTSLPVKPVGVANSAKPDETVKTDLKSDVYIKNEGNSEAKMCSLEIQQNPVKNEPTSPVNISSEHETVALMKDIKEFENVFEETKLKFEMEEQQSVCIPEMENIPETKPQILTAVDVSQEPQSLTTHQTVLVQPPIMLHKPQMIITSAPPNKPTVFCPKIEKVFSLRKDCDERLLLTQKPTKDIQLKMEEGSQSSHVTLAYVSHQSTSSTVQKPLVVVTNYGQPPSSPAPSITSQSSSSPNSIVSTSSFSNTASTTKGSSKSKGRSVKSTSNTSKSSPVSKPQQKPQEDANTAQKIYAILEEYAVQLRNSPDMNNRPAPRRRSNPPACANSKKKRTVCKTKESLSDGDDGNYSEDVTEPLASSEDSSNGVTVLQVCVTTSH